MLARLRASLRLPPAFGRADNHSPRRTDRDGRPAHRAPDRGAARRDALGGTLLGAAGELGVAQARRAEAAEAIAAAAERAREIVRAAKAEAAAVVDRARQEATEADTGYAAAWRAATTAGWAPAQLRGMGYPRPVTPRRHAAAPAPAELTPCLLYTSDAADEEDSVDLGGRRII